MLRNTTGNTVMVYSTLDGIPQNSEYYQATLKPGAEVTLEGRNEADDRYDIYARIYSTNESPEGPTKGSMVSWLSAKYDISGAAISAGSDNEERVDQLLTEGETHDNWGIDGSSFNAWVHRDSDTGDYGERVTLKVTFNKLGETATPNNYRHPKAATHRFVNSTDQPIDLWQRSSCGKNSQKGPTMVIAANSTVTLTDNLDHWGQADIESSIKFRSDGKRIDFSSQRGTYTVVEGIDGDYVHDQTAAYYSPNEARVIDCWGHRLETKRISTLGTPALSGIEFILK